MALVDRIPTKPNRVLITPENGGAAYYATMTRADEPTTEGTPLNKANLTPVNIGALSVAGGTMTGVLNWATDAIKQASAINLNAVAAQPLLSSATATWNTINTPGVYDVQNVGGTAPGSPQGAPGYGMLIVFRGMTYAVVQVYIGAYGTNAQAAIHVRYRYASGQTFDGAQHWTRIRYDGISSVAPVA